MSLSFPYWLLFRYTNKGSSHTPTESTKTPVSSTETNQSKVDLFLHQSTDWSSATPRVWSENVHFNKHTDTSSYDSQIQACNTAANIIREFVCKLLMYKSDTDLKKKIHPKPCSTDR